MLKLLLLLFTIQLCTPFHVVPMSYSILSENTESVIDLAGKVSEKRFYLHITNEASPFFMYVTPCGAAVHWQLFTMDKDISMSEEFDTISDMSNSLEESEKFKLIAGEDDKKRMTFFAHSLPKKVILVVRAASTSSASVRIFFTPSLFRLEDQYPPLPHDTRLATNIISESTYSRRDEVSTLITWKISPQVRNAEPGRYRICTIVSRRDPEFAGMCDHVEEGVETVKCVPQTNNTVVIGSLRRDRTYFVTVFVRDHKRGTSSAYEVQTIQTSEVVTHRRKVTRNVPRKQKKSAPRVLSNGQLEQVELEPKKGTFVNLKFFVNSLPEGAENNTQSAMLIVHACDGLVRINLFRNGKILKRSDAFSGFRRFVVTNIRSGHLRFQIVNDDETPKTIRVWASTDLTTSPYPNLPDDTSVKIVGRSCSSASIQWIRAHDSHVKYCVYRRREHSNFLEHLVSLADNLCEGGLSSSVLVGCYTHSPTSSEDDAQSLIETTIGGLLPASTYRLDLLATPLDRPNAQALPFRTVWVRTNRFCGVHN
ncbi:Protein NDNF C-terminal domain-containing protein [Caenorhabditis elegans]|uniref:Protein NDNF C-terminal domain-containing protein n=1 Tax=Caenorhabditis elegans TaxID=6239 RepID=Q9N397_CAEEL|nr:Protein NDNF C-terminal domain-containing protein [Caenorhabditis elegans]CCD83520.1 Protein NDNF C-terminal domain-containing protein [Caenorhabditis elegans]|eukprot:NP_500282.2 NDNF (Neuron Derived Neurotrophic Factor) homolog [Caenorhabditis elegans]